MKYKTLSSRHPAPAGRACPKFRPPFERISYPQIPLMRLLDRAVASPPSSPTVSTSHSACPSADLPNRCTRRSPLSRATGASSGLLPPESLPLTTAVISSLQQNVLHSSAPSPRLSIAGFRPPPSITRPG